MTYIDIDGKWHVYVQDAGAVDSTACGITEWDYDPPWQTGEPEKLCAKCAKATKSDAGSKYPARIKARAVGMALVDGTNRTAEALGIPKQTISNWVHDPEYAEMVGQLRTKSREDVADETWAAFQVGIREVAKGLVGDAPLRDKAIAAGVLYDKFALMTGSATSRTEARDITGSLSDVDVIAAIHEAHALAVGAGAPQAAEDTTEG